MIDFIGKKFGRLLVLETGTPRKQSDGKNRTTVICKCDCGIIKEYTLHSLKSGNTKSCGCFRKEVTKKAVTTHGLRYHPLYQVWLSIKKRCLNPNEPGYINYGARGIKICKEWVNDSAKFINWALNNGWQKGLEIDRRKNNGNYTPKNCRFTTRKINSRNRRSNKTYLYKKEKKILIEWTETLNIPYFRTLWRLRLGWTFKDAVETPQLRTHKKLPQIK